MYLIPVLMYWTYLIGDFDNFGKENCFVNSNDNTCLKSGDLDMTQQFRNLVIAGSILSMATWLSIVICSNIWTPSPTIIIIICLDMPISLVWIVCLSYFRFSHGGKVVSGDYSIPTDDNQYYMISTGRMFKGWLITIYSLIGLAVLSGIFGELKKRITGQQ